MIPVRDNPIPGRIKKELPPYVKRKVAAPFTVYAVFDFPASLSSLISFIQIPRFVCLSSECLSLLINSHDSLNSPHTEKSESIRKDRNSSNCSRYFLANAQASLSFCSSVLFNLP